MAARAIGSGTISFGLVSIPVKVYTATSPKGVHFNMLHEKCGGRVKQQFFCPVDNEVVVPVNKIVRVQVIGADVIHAFAVPSFGIKIDAVPGRLNETWFQATREGVYYGQCSELCGKDHAYMPIAVRVVSERDYAAWLEQAKKKYASTDTPAPQATTLAAAE